MCLASGAEPCVNAPLARAYSHMSNDRMEQHCEHDECCRKSKDSIYWIFFQCSIYKVAEKSVDFFKKMLTAPESFSTQEHQNSQANTNALFTYSVREQVHRRRGYYYTEDQTRLIKRQ